MMKILKNRLYILGTRGIPASHGGFETFAEHLSVYLTQNGWDIYIYCQEKSEIFKIVNDSWQGVHRIIIQSKFDSTFGTILFDILSSIHCLLQKKGVVLTLGYNTAFLGLFYRIFNVINITNMDGIEWRRSKWRLHEKIWLWINERLGCLCSNHLIADHPAIATHLATRVDSNKITMIPYGGDEVISADSKHIKQYGLIPNEYSIIIARPEPENSLLEMISAFSISRREHRLVVLGNFHPEVSPYHEAVLKAASDEVLFLGAIYDKPIIHSLRFHCRYYFHGHQVGGTNPSLVEALAAGCAVIAHDNVFNRWVTGDTALYFSDMKDCKNVIDIFLHNNHKINALKIHNKKIFHDLFEWKFILNQYNQLLSYWHSKVKHT